MYTYESRVRFSEVNHYETMTLPSIINYFQDGSIFQSEDIGLGVDYLKEKKRAWVLSSWQVVIERYPRIGEKIRIGTWATGFQGLYGYRNFCMWDEKGAKAAYANSIWVYMDLEKQRPARPPKEEVEKYGTEEALEMEYAPRKISLPQDALSGEIFPVRKYHIDTNEHVNNCQYVQMALEAAGEELMVRQMRAEYKKSALLHDKILPKVAKEGERTVVELCEPDGGVYAVVELTGEKRC